MSMTRPRARRSPGDKARADAIVAAAKNEQSVTVTIARLRPTAYTIFMPDQHQNVYHFILESPNLVDKDRFDPDQPRGLLYTKTDGPSPGYKLVGVMYMARYDATEEELNARSRSLSLAMARPPQHVVFHSSPNNATGS